MANQAGESNGKVLNVPSGIFDGFFWLPRISRPNSSIAE